MLINASLCWDDILRCFRSNSHNKEWLYYSPLVNYEPIYDINKFQYGVFGMNGLIGYIEARVDGRIIRDVSTVSWGEGTHVIRETIKFCCNLFDVYGYSKIVYACIYNNTIFPLLEKICTRYGARYVGTFCAERMGAGKMRDVVYWEIHRNDYMRKKQAIKIGNLI